MAVVNYSLGQLNPVVYFFNGVTGDVAIPPSTEDAQRYRQAMSAKGYEIREARNLQEIDELQKYMERREFAQAEADYDRTERSIADRRKAIRDRLTTRMISSSCSPYERDFIRAYLQLRDDKREQYRKRFTADIAAQFVQRNYDNPSNHYEDVANKVKEGRDLECTRCHKFRRLDEHEVCFRCLYGIDPNMQLG